MQVITGLDILKRVEPNDFVISMRSFEGGLEHSEITGCISSAYVMLVPSPLVEPRFFRYLFKSRSYIQALQATTNLVRDGQALRYDNFTQVPLPLPPSAEQAAIATFLDRETGNIDALIEAQRRLIELLKEKRQAVISHAVTRGLDPSAPMKDSGIEWLGEVPSHWDVAHIKRFCTVITDGAHISPETDGGVYCFVSTVDVSDDGIDFENCLRTSPESFEYMRRTGCQPESGDVLFSKDGTIGRTVVVSDAPPFVVASSLIIIRPDSRQLDAEYLDFLCQSGLVRNQVASFVKGAGLPRLSIANLLRVIGVVPPLREQEEIAERLRAIVTGFRALILECERGVDTLQERRSALISAAVTGKIDVRGLVPVEAEAA